MANLEPDETDWLVDADRRGDADHAATAHLAPLLPFGPKGASGHLRRQESSFHLFATEKHGRMGHSNIGIGTRHSHLILDDIPWMALTAASHGLQQTSANSRRTRIAIGYHHRRDRYYLTVKGSFTQGNILLILSLSLRYPTDTNNWI